MGVVLIAWQTIGPPGVGNEIGRAPTRTADPVPQPGQRGTEHGRTGADEPVSFPRATGSGH